MALRDRFVGWLAWVVVIFISIPFALWGIQDYLSPSVKSIALEVDDIEIGVPKYQDRAQKYRSLMQRALGEKYDPAKMENAIKKRVIGELVREALLVRISVDANLRVGDDQLSREVKSQKAFYVDGKFNVQQYRRRVSQEGYSVKDYENNFRSDLVLTTIPSAILSSEFVTADEQERLMLLKDQERDVTWLSIPVAGYMDQVSIPNKDIQSYYDLHKTEFMLPEELRLDYIELSSEAIASQQAVDEGSLREYYDKNIDLYSTKEKRKASHILVEAPAGGELPSNVIDKVTKISAALDSGRTFGDIAREFSEDAGSAETGGDLGIITRGLMEAAFENMLFSLEEGKVSAPVRTSFGVQFIKADKIYPIQVKSFDEVRTDIEKTYLKNEAQKKFIEYSERMSELAYEHPDTLAPAAEEVGINIKTTDWFSRAKPPPGVISHPKVLEAAHTPDVLTAGRNSDPIEIEPDHWIVLRLNDYKPARQISLDEVKSQVESRLKTKAAIDKATIRAGQMLAELKNGQKPESLSKNGVTLKQFGYIRRDHQEAPPQVRSLAFRLPKPGIEGSASYGSTALPGGDQAVVVVNAVRNVDIAKLTDKETAQTTAQYRAALANDEITFLINTLKSEAAIVVHEDRL